MQSSLLSIIIIPKLSNVDYSTAFLNLGVRKGRYSGVAKLFIEYFLVAKVLQYYVQLSWKAELLSLVQVQRTQHTNYGAPFVCSNFCYVFLII